MDTDEVPWLDTGKPSPLRFDREGDGAWVHYDPLPGLEGTTPFHVPIQDARELLQGLVHTRIAQALAFLADRDALNLVAWSAISHCCFSGPVVHGGGGHAHPLIAVYLQSLATARPLSIHTAVTTKSCAQWGNDLAHEIFVGANFLYASAMLTRLMANDSSEQLPYLHRNYLLNVLVDGTREQSLSIARDLFGPHADFLRDRLGFDLGAFLSLVPALDGCVDAATRQWSSSSKQGHRSTSPLTAFSISPRYLGVDERILKVLALAPGDNHAMLAGEGYAGWPISPSRVFFQPLVQCDGRYYCFCPYLLSAFAVERLEWWMKETDLTYFQERYCPRRSAFLEGYATRLLKEALPDASAWSNLYYRYVEDDQERVTDVDGLVRYGTTFVVVEAKSKELSPSARRGSVDRLKRDAEAILAKAAAQIERTRHYLIDGTGDICFWSDPQLTKLTLRLRRDEIERFYGVNVTLTRLGPTASSFRELTDQGVLPPRPQMWSASLWDVQMAISMAKSPIRLLHFLERRIAINDRRLFCTYEPELILAYLEHGLALTAQEFLAKDPTVVVDGGHNYLKWIAHYGSLDDIRSAIPRKDVPAVVEQLVAQLFRSGGGDAVYCGLRILDLDGMRRENDDKPLISYFADQLSKAQMQAIVSNQRASMIWGGGQIPGRPGPGFTINVGLVHPSRKQLYHIKQSSFSQMKHHGLKEWLWVCWNFMSTDRQSLVAGRILLDR